MSYRILDLKNGTYVTTPSKIYREIEYPERYQAEYYLKYNITVWTGRLKHEFEIVEV